MPTVNSSHNARAELWLLGAGVILCSFLHLAALSGRPGLHYDEAWALNYSWRIATEPGFWPWRAMSPYTAPVAHYWAAAWLKLLGPSLLVFRLSQAALSLGAIFLLTYELRRRGLTRAASLLPWTAALLPGLPLNHRFAIELTGVHPFLLALMAAALLRGRPGAAALCWVTATLAHVLFYGVGLGLVAAALWEKRRLSDREYRALVAGAGVLALFFLHVLLSIPERGKAAGLLLSALLLPVVASPRICLPGWRPRFLPWALAAAFLFNLLFFAEGQWTVAVFTGREPNPALAFEALLFLPLVAWYGFLGARGFPRLWFLFSLLILGVMMLKPAPRYFELPLLALAVFVACGLARLDRRKFAPGFAFLLAHAATIGVSFFTAAPVERPLRALFFRDSSRDFLDKQSLARFLGRNGCKLDDIKSVDSRVREALLALSRRDWPVEGARCRWADLRVERAAAAGFAGSDAVVADFALEGNWDGR